MRDACGRSINYLRLSITDACSMRCTYCRPKDVLPARSKSLLSPSEIHALVSHLVLHRGLTKVRLTGGEPTTRADLVEIITRLSSIKGLREIALTTNGLTLARDATRLAAAGLHRLNVSLDSLSPDTFHQMSGIDGLSQVLEGIDSVRSESLHPVKINTVVVRGQNDHELLPLLEFASDRQLEIRFIELMPMGPLADVWSQRFVSADETRTRLGKLVPSWEPLGHSDAPARRYRATLHNRQTVTVGFITAMSCNFCGSCNRIRVAANGDFYPCLMDHPQNSVLPALRPVFNAVKLDRVIDVGLAVKPQTHPSSGVTVMTSIGG